MKTETIIDNKELAEIIDACKVCHVAMVDSHNMPYVLPFNFAFKDNVLYLHSGKEGTKNEIFKSNRNICVAFTIEKDLYIQSETIACSYSMMFESVLLYGKIEEVEDFEEKIQILHQIMHKYTPNRNYAFAEPSVKNVACFKVVAQKLTGRKRG